MEGLKYYPQFCYAAVLANVILFIMYFMKKNYPTKHNRLFFALLVDNAIASASNILTFYVISYPEKYPIWLSYVSNIFYLFVFNMMAVLFLLYIDVITKIPKLYVPVRVYAAIIILYDAILLSTSPVTKLAIYFDDNLNYQHGPLMNSLYVTAFFSVIFANVIFFMVNKRFNYYQVFSITGFVMAVLLSVIFQVYHPAYVINNLVCTLVMFFIFTSFENQAYFLFGDTSCFNRRAFTETVHRLYKKDRTYSLTVVNVFDFESYTHSIAGNSGDIFTERIAERLTRFFGKKAYCLGINAFVIFDENMDASVETAKKVLRIFKTPFEIRNMAELHSVEAKPFCKIIEVNEDKIEGYEMVEIIGNLEKNYSKDILIIKDLKKRLEAIRREKAVLHLIDKTIERDSFMVYYQPILDTTTNLFSTAEALVRMKDENNNFISPEEFIPIAERNGRIDDIGDSVLNKVCAFINNNKESLHMVNHIAVNLSPVQCRKTDTSDNILNILKKYNISSELINVELTETSGVSQDSMLTIQNIISHLHDNGIGFSLDDFGSGFAAIDYLIEFSFDVVKIDKSILWQAMKDKDSMIVLTNTMNMVHEIGRHIVVEGVETEEMASLLRERNCDYMQGYLYSKPLPPKDYLEFLEKHAA